MMAKLTELQDSIRVLRDEEYDLILAITNKMAKKKVELSDGSVIERSRSINRKWDGPALVSQVARRAAEKALRGNVSGEPLPEPLPEIVGAIVGDLNKTLAISYGRLGALSEIGIDADEYAEKSPGRWSVKKVQAAQTDIPSA
jgi:hypothetical protein